MIVIDANCLIKLLEGNAQDDSYKHLQSLFEVAASSKEILGIPTIVLAEVACGYTASEKSKVFRKNTKVKKYF